MAQAKQKPEDDKLVAKAKKHQDNLAGAPELSDEQRTRLESELSVRGESHDHEDTTADELEEAWTKPDVTLGDNKNAIRAGNKASAQSGGSGGNFLQRFFGGYWRRKAWSLPLTLLLLVGVLAAVPTTRYALAAYVVSKPVTVTVIDESTQKPVSSADVKLAGKTVQTDSKGVAKFAAVKVGQQELTVSKKYYKNATQSFLVDLSKGANRSLKITATGRQVPISVVNKLTGKPLENVTLKASGTEVKTDKEGKAVIVLPADKPDLPISLSNGGFNGLEARVKVTDQALKENNFALVPTGKVYFLSRLSGKIDVVKTDLDGANRATVVQGTGKEEDRGTVLLASRDWKYLAFLSKRDSTLPKLYLIDTTTDKMVVMDEGDASFVLSGWSGHDFMYSVTRNKIEYTQANRQAIKSFNADKKQLMTLDQTTSEVDGQGGTAYQSFENFSLVGDKLVYTVSYGYAVSNWYGPGITGKANTIRHVTAGVSNKADLRAFPIGSNKYVYINAWVFGPEEVYLRVGGSDYPSGKELLLEYEHGKLVVAPESERDKFNVSIYPTYLVSPGGKKTFWNESRDGRQTFFVGNAEGEEGKQVAVIEEGQVYGWYGDDYLLASKKGSELYILPVGGGEPVKVADYHKPELSYRGYGGGYGGL